MIKKKKGDEKIERLEKRRIEKKETERKNEFGRICKGRTYIFASI